LQHSEGFEERTKVKEREREKEWRKPIVTIASLFLEGIAGDDLQNSILVENLLRFEHLAYRWERAILINWPMESEHV